jgi:hypothetical protein
MYRQVLADAAHARGWAVHLFDARDAESRAAAVLGARAEEVLAGPRTALGPPWAKDHRTALAATVLAEHGVPAERGVLAEHGDRRPPPAP